MAAPEPARPLSGRITALEVQARDPDRVNLFLEGRFAFGLSNKVVADAAARRKLPAIKAADYVEFGRKLGGFLQRRGFPPDVTWDVVRTLWRERTGESAPPAE